MIDFSTLQGLTIPEGVVTQIADASGRVLWKAGPVIIQFTVDGVVYTTTKGLTWRDVGSRAFGTPTCITNAGGNYPIFMDNGTTIRPNGLSVDYQIVDSNKNAVAPTDTIIPDEIYTTDYSDDPDEPPDW